MIALFPMPDPDPGSNLAHERYARGKCSQPMRGPNFDAGAVMRN